MKKIITKTGYVGWQERLQMVYKNYEEFCYFARVYNIHERLGFHTIKGCWHSNPLVQGSTNPKDFRRVNENIKRKS